MPASLIFIGTHDARERATRIGAARIAVGASTLLPPSLARHILGLRTDEVTGASVFFTRMFGIRNAVLGAWVLSTLDQSKEQRRFVYRVNAAVDAADMAVLVLSALSGRMPKRFFALSAVLGCNALLGFLELASEV